MILSKINKVLAYIAGGLIVAASLVMLFDVISRYIFGQPNLYANYIAAFMILGSAFLGTAYALQAGGHVHVEIIVDKLPRIPRNICYTIGYLLAMVFTFFMTKSCFGFAVRAAQNNWKAQGNLPLPSVILYGIMALGAALLFLTLILRIVEQWQGKRDIVETEDEEI